MNKDGVGITFAEAEKVVDDYLGVICTDSPFNHALIKYQEEVRKLKGEINHLKFALKLTEDQRVTTNRYLQIAKTAIREVQTRMNHDGTAIGVYKSYWNILESGFKGNYRNDYEKQSEVNK